MRAIDEVADQELNWSQPAVRRQHFELQAGADTVARLDFSGGTLASAETGRGSWTFKREGFWHPRITVRRPGSDVDVAQFQPGWSGGGILQVPSRSPTRFNSANLWRSQWSWHDETGTELIQFKVKQGLMRTQGVVLVRPPGRDSDQLDLLAVLGWYLLILLARDSTVASVAAIPAVTA